MIRIKSSCPCKCIISGEHSVVYGQPGISAAMNTLIKMDGVYSFLDNKDEIKLVLRNTNYKNTTITMITTEFKQFIYAFVKQKLSLDQLEGLLGPAFDDKDVMGACMAFALVFRKIQEITNVSLVQFAAIISRFNCLLLIKSDIPIGVGLGSSASFICALMMNYYVRFQRDCN